MNHSTTAAIVAAIALVGAASASAQAPVLPAALTPGSIAGSGIRVIDLQAEKAWYESRLGLKAVASFPAGAAKPYEYVMAAGGGGAILALLKAKRPDGANSFSRIIINAPDPKGLAQFLAAQGAPMREVIPGTAYFVTDPEGNDIELYRAPAAKP